MSFGTIHIPFPIQRALDPVDPMQWLRDLAGELNAHRAAKRYEQADEVRQIINRQGMRVEISKSIRCVDATSGELICEVPA